MSLINDGVQARPAIPAERSAAGRAAIAAGGTSRAWRHRLDSGDGGGFISRRRVSFHQLKRVQTQGSTGSRRAGTGRNHTCHGTATG